MLDRLPTAKFLQSFSYDYGRSDIGAELLSGTKRKASKPDANFIPVHLAQGFQTALFHLVEELGETNGRKGEYLRAEYLTKYLDPKGVPSCVRAANAIAKWSKQELKNRTTNRRILIGDEDFGWTTSDRLIKKARKILSTLLGPLVYPDVFRSGCHTNGASTRVRRGSEAAILKHIGEAHVSSSALKHWLQFGKNTILSDQVLCPHETNVLFTVDKKTDIDRVACKEPEINMFLQRSIGSHIRHRLRRFGIDLNDQSINRGLAKSAVKRNLATIDLSSASDSITRQLVIALLPFDWWHLLDDIRVHSTSVDGYEDHELEMFSSMGNGFTFELESAIFWALTRAVMHESGIRGTVSVYGDDIIAPCAIAPRLARIFNWFGFSVNQKKSSWSGPFRESCGGHYHNSYDISPFYLKDPVTRKTDVIRLLNFLMEWDSREVGFITDTSILKFHRHWSALIPKHLHGGQDPFDSSALVTGAKPNKRLVPVTEKVDVPRHAALVCWFTTRECTGDLPIALLPTKHIRHKTVDMPYWTVRTTWDPWYIQEAQLV